MNTESTLTVRWPTITATAPGRWVGRFATVGPNFGTVVSLGTLLSVVTVPISLAVYAWQLMPFVARRYRLTDRRVVIERGLTPVEDRAIGYDEFDVIEVETLPGQEWLHSGELVFRRDGKEVLRFSGISRPEVFRQVCLEAQNARLAVDRVLGREQAEAQAG
ncbi:MAG: PH domain-containing protein [Pirellulales bacterium]|nr:PH domain-containing protein [Pirellulales bacterium]